MTTRDYADAYDDDSENVRSWAAQDAQEPEQEEAPCQCPEHLAYRASLVFNSDEREFALEGDPLAMWDEIVKLRILCGKAADHLGRVMAQRNVALTALARVEALAEQWEHAWPDAAARLLQVLDEAALGITGRPVE
jgi:hypothetical protein